MVIDPSTVEISDDEGSTDEEQDKPKLEARAASPDEKQDKPPVDLSAAFDEAFDEQETPNVEASAVSLGDEQDHPKVEASAASDDEPEQEKPESAATASSDEEQEEKPKVEASAVTASPDEEQAVTASVAPALLEARRLGIDLSSEEPDARRIALIAALAHQAPEVCVGLDCSVLLMRSATTRTEIGRNALAALILMVGADGAVASMLLRRNVFSAEMQRIVAESDGGPILTFFTKLCCAEPRARRLLATLPMAHSLSKIMLLRRSEAVRAIGALVTDKAAARDFLKSGGLAGLLTPILFEEAPPAPSEECALAIRVLQLLDDDDEETFLGRSSLASISLLLERTEIAPRRLALLVLTRLMQQRDKPIPGEKKKQQRKSSSTSEKLFVSGLLPRIAWLLGGDLLARDAAEQGDLLARDAAECLLVASKCTRGVDWYLSFVEQGCVPLIHMLGKEEDPALTEVLSELRACACSQERASTAVLDAVLLNEHGAQQLRVNVAIALVLLRDHHHVSSVASCIASKRALLEATVALVRSPKRNKIRQLVVPPKAQFEEECCLVALVESPRGRQVKMDVPPLRILAAASQGLATLFDGQNTPLLRGAYRGWEDVLIHLNSAASHGDALRLEELRPCSQRRLLTVFQIARDYDLFATADDAEICLVEHLLNDDDDDDDCLPILQAALDHKTPILATAAFRAVAQAHTAVGPTVGHRRRKTKQASGATIQAALAEFISHWLLLDNNNPGRIEKQ